MCLSLAMLDHCGLDIVDLFENPVKVENTWQNNQIFMKLLFETRREEVNGRRNLEKEMSFTKKKFSRMFQHEIYESFVSHSFSMTIKFGMPMYSDLIIL